MFCFLTCTIAESYCLIGSIFLYGIIPSGAITLSSQITSCSNFIDLCEISCSLLAWAPILILPIDINSCEQKFQPNYTVPLYILPEECLAFTGRTKKTTSQYINAPVWVHGHVSKSGIKTNYSTSEKDENQTIPNYPKHPGKFIIKRDINILPVEIHLKNSNQERDRISNNDNLKMKHVTKMDDKMTSSISKTNNIDENV